MTSNLSEDFISEDIVKLLELMQQIVLFKQKFKDTVECWEISSETEKEILDNDIKIQKPKIQAYLNKFSVIIDKLKPIKIVKKFVSLFNENWVKIDCDEEPKNFILISLWTTWNWKITCY